MWILSSKSFVFSHFLYQTAQTWRTLCKLCWLVVEQKRPYSHAVKCSLEPAGDKGVDVLDEVTFPTWRQIRIFR